MQKTSMQWKTYSSSKQKMNSLAYATKILDAQYEWTDVKNVVDKLTHLNTHQNADLL